MHVKVKLFANFRVGRFAVDTRDYAPGARVADIIAELAIPESEVGMIMLDHRPAEPDEVLHEGASLALFPALGGG